MCCDIEILLLSQNVPRYKFPSIKRIEVSKNRPYRQPALLLHEKYTQLTILYPHPNEGIFNFVQFIYHLNPSKQLSVFYSFTCFIHFIAKVVCIIAIEKYCILLRSLIHDKIICASLIVRHWHFH